jgi:hypothetical protein
MFLSKLCVISSILLGMFLIINKSNVDISNGLRSNDVLILRFFILILSK